MEKIEDLIKKFDCWRFWGYLLVASYQYYRICTTFRIKRLRWAGVHSEVARMFPVGESTTPKDVLGRLSSRRRALRKMETWTTLHVELLFFFRHGRALVRARVSAPFLLSAKKARQRMKTKENRWGRVHQELRQVFCRTPPHTPLAVLRRIQRYKAWEVHCGSWDQLMTSRLLEQGRVHRELATLGAFFSDHHQSMDHKDVLKWLWGRVRRRILPTWLMTKRSVSSVSIEPRTKRP